MKSMKIKTPKMPKPITSGPMSPGKGAFPRSVSSTTTHSLPAMKAPTMPSFDSQIGGTPSVTTKVTSAPSIPGIKGIKPLGGM